MPAIKPQAEKDKYDIYPAHGIGEGKIFRGIHSLATKISGEKIVIIDGFSGVFFNRIKTELDSILASEYDIEAQWIDMNDLLKPEEDINRMITPFLGGDDPFFGRRTTLSLSDFFDTKKLPVSLKNDSPSHYIIYGAGAALYNGEGFLVYFDLPKNEFQFRLRAGSVNNLGVSAPSDSRSMYKRSYFVDWVVLNRHKQNIIEKIDILVDCQREDDLVWINGEEFRNILHYMGRDLFRVRPWFEPGTWGGSWIKENIPGINKDVLNYAWSFEMITPENGLILESDGLMLEFSFDFLMYQEAKAVLGDCYERFGTEFPIRFDFLDTFDGGNLSIQCHPRPEYMKENFGENITQEETYYILDTKDNAVVYLGFEENIDKEEFRKSLETGFNENIPVRIEDFIRTHNARKHDLFLIPYGTIHGSGKNNLVLEISSTPYIFTFKMYDWLRPDLDGNPRPLNIERGMDNLFFERKGDKVNRELISKPVLLEEGNDWQLFHLPTHVTHLYDVHRYHFRTSVKIKTRNKCHVLNLVEGESIIVNPFHGRGRRFNYAETFVIPAAADSYTLLNESEKPAILVLAFVK